MTQTIVQGPEDPLLVLDHQGGSGNPSFLIQQDENAAAYIWWDQVNQVFNMGPASAGSPSLSIASNGNVSMAFAASINNLTVGELLVNGGTIKALTVSELLVNGGGIQLNQNMEVGGVITTNQLTTNQLIVQNGARVTNGMEADNMLVTGTVTAGNFVESSSREIKENIVDLSSQEALEVLEHLSPVKFNYKVDDAEKAHIGFIAEDVPRSVASSDGKGISLTDIVSVLTRAVKEQQKTINTLSEKCHSLELAVNRARR